MSFSAFIGKPSRRISRSRMFRMAGDGSLRCRHFGLPSVTFVSQSKAAITLTSANNCFEYRVSQPFSGPLPNGEAPQNLALKKASIFWQGALAQAGRCASLLRCSLGCGATPPSNIARARRTVISHLETGISSLPTCLDIMPAKPCMATHPATCLTASYPCDSKPENDGLPVS